MKASNINEHPLPLSFILLDEIDSTNTYLKSHSDSIRSDTITVIRAKRQTAGKGTRGKSWISEEGNLFVSLGCTVLLTEHSVALSHLIATICCERFACYGIDLQIKWPNDLLLFGKKCGGILTEIVTRNQESVIIIGVGINMISSPKDLQKNQQATDCHSECGIVLDLDLVTREIAEAFSHDLPFVLSYGFNALRDRYSTYLREKEGYVFQRNGITYIAQGISKEGFLLSYSNSSSIIHTLPIG